MPIPQKFPSSSEARGPGGKTHCRDLLFPSCAGEAGLCASGVPGEEGDTLYIIESMKLMNEVASEFDGVVAEYYVQDGDPVEYGQPILRLE